MSKHYPQRSARRTAAMAAVLLCAALVAPVRAGAAGSRGTVLGSESVSGGTWAATAGPTSMTFTTNTYQTSTVTNTGTVALSAISYKVTIANPASGSPTFKVFACAVAWVSNLCSGGTGTQAGGTLTKNTITTVTSTVVPAVGGKVHLQVEPSGVSASVTVTLGTSITSPTQLRAAVKTNG
ncbi:MAG TPA: hypothetical protein VII19_12255 [Acidimicrobiales bacterium]